jgi:hypothetical protein
VSYEDCGNLAKSSLSHSSLFRVPEGSPFTANILPDVEELTGNYRRNTANQLLLRHESYPWDGLAYRLKAKVGKQCSHTLFDELVLLVAAFVKDLEP